MRLLVIFWSGLGNPRHIATKSPSFVWLWFWFEKVVIGSDTIPLLVGNTEPEGGRGDSVY